MLKSPGLLVIVPSSCSTGLVGGGCQFGQGCSCAGALCLLLTFLGNMGSRFPEGTQTGRREASPGA